MHRIGGSMTAIIYHWKDVLTKLNKQDRTLDTMLTELDNLNRNSAKSLEMASTFVRDAKKAEDKIVELEREIQQHRLEKANAQHGDRDDN